MQQQHNSLNAFPLIFLHKWTKSPSITVYVDFRKKVEYQVKTLYWDTENIGTSCSRPEALEHYKLFEE